MHTTVDHFLDIKYLNEVPCVHFHNLYSSPNTIRMIKSNKMRCSGHISRMRELSNSYRISSFGKPETKDQLGDLDVVGRIIKM